LPRRRILDQRADPAEDFTGPATLLDDGIDRLASFVENRWLDVKPAQSGIRVGDHRANRLIDFMGDRGRELSHGRDTIDAR